MLKSPIMAKKEKPIFKIAYDVDGSLLASEMAILDAANDRLRYFGFNRTILKSDLDEYDALFYLVYKLTKSEDLAKEIRNYWYDPKILRRSPPNHALIEVFNRLHDFKDISQIVITSRPVSSCGATLHSLNEYIPYIDWTSADPQKLFMRATNDVGVGGTIFKLDEVRKQKVNFLFDDGPIDIHQLKIIYPECDYAYITQPWNINCTDEEAENHRISFDTDTPDSIILRVLESQDRFLSSLPSTRTSKPRLVAN